MKRKQELRKFVRENYVILKEKDVFDKKKYQALKKAYFGTKLRHQFGIPKDMEICDVLIEFIIQSQRILEKEKLNTIISETPFLKLNNIKAGNYIGLMDILAKKYAVKEDLENVIGIEKQDKIIELIKKERTKEIQDLIDKKKEEYRKLPSILDDKDIEEPEELPKEVGEKEWWEDLNLKENPFQGPLDGFFLIDKSLYDEIIVETPPIQWALRLLQKDKIDIFHRGYLLGGEFGTGKTTFFDFMSPHFNMLHIEPVRIAISESITEAHYMQKFEKELCINISKLAKKYGLSEPSRIVDFEEARCLMIDIQNRGAKGYLIFIDDLHKNIEVNKVFNFLANLQITKNIFSRDEINVTFMVAGFPNWREKIKQDSALTGFFDAADVLILPEVTPELAAQAIKKRLQAFSINPNREIAIKDGFLKSIFKRVSLEIGLKNIGFRPYIQEAIKNFQEKRFDILSIDFTKLDESVTEDLKRYLENNNEFKDKINKLIFGGGIKKQKVRETTLKILCEVYLRDGVTEDEGFFKSNVFPFKQLNNSGLIQKYDRYGKLVWKVVPVLVELNKRIIEKYNLSLEDYLVPIYSATTVQTKEPASYDNKIDTYRKYYKKVEGSLDPPVRESLKRSLDLFTRNLDPFTGETLNRIRNIDKLPSILEIRDSIWEIMKSIILFESPNLLDMTNDPDIKTWTLRHRTLEYSHHFISMEQKLENASIEKSDITRLLSFAKDAFNELWNEFKQSHMTYQSCNVKCHEIPRKVLEIFFAEYSHILTLPREEYYISLKKIIECVEDTIRHYLLGCCTLIFGPYHERVKYFPEQIKKYILKQSPSSAVSYESYNEFENLNRGQYRLLFTQIGRSSLFFKQVISPVISGWDSTDLETFFSLFGDLNIVCSHNKKISVEDRRKDIPTFFRLACRFISNLSKRLRDLVMLNNIAVLSTDKISVYFGDLRPNDKILKRVIKSQEMEVPSTFYCHEIIYPNLEKLKEKLMANSDDIYGNIEIDLLDVEATRIKFNMNYSESIPLITYLYAENRVRILPLYGSNLSLMKI